MGETEGAHFITMEYVRGEDLRSSIRRFGQLPIGKSISIASQICDGLAEAHSQGVVHRDLKSNNIMIDKEGNVRIMDFGIARSLTRKSITDKDVMIGTPKYMSPEQVEGKPLRQGTDIYSLGIILYEMLTGHVPFDADTALSVAYKHVNEVPTEPKKINAQIPENLNRLILKCLEKEREKRYQSAEEMRSDLENVEKDLPLTDREIPRKKPLTSKEITVQFSLKKLYVPVVAILAIAIIAVILWRLFHKREVVPLPQEKQSIAVISFKNQTGDSTFDYLGEAIPNLLITSLEQSEYLSVTTWQRMSDLLKQLGKEDTEFINQDLGFELCRLDGIDAIVLGSFIKAGDMFATDAKVLDVKTKKLLKSVSSRGEGAGSILERQIDELSNEISKGVGIPERKIKAAQKPIVEVTTDSLSAYNFFLRGREDYGKFYFDDARRFLEKAVELDPTFAEAYLYLSLAHQMLGNYKERDETYEKARSFSESAPIKERLYIEAFYARDIEKDREKYFRILKQMEQKYSKEKKIYYSLGLEYKERGLFKEAINEFQKTLQLDPEYGSALNEIAYTYANLNNFEKAIEYFENYVAVSPGDANPFDSMAELYFIMGKLEEAIEYFEKTLEIKPDFGSEWNIAYVLALRENYAEATQWIEQLISKAPSPGLKAEGLIWKGFYRYWLGSSLKSLDDLRSAEELAQSVGNDLWVAWIDWVRGWVYYDKGEYELSRKSFQNWFDILARNFPPSEDFFKGLLRIYLSYVDLRQEQIDSAKVNLVEIESFIDVLNPFSKRRIEFRHDLLNAEILLADGLVDESIKVGQEILPLDVDQGMLTWYVISYNFPFLKDVLARAYQQKGERDKAIAEYERLITFDPQSKDRSLIHPLYHFRLALLYEQKGWKGKAIEHYEKFLSLWKDADPGIAEVEDARERLARLKELS